MNKKGASFSGWTEGIILTVLISTIVISIVVSMNEDYGLNYQTGLSDNDTLLDFAGYSTSASQELGEGEPEFTSDGLTLTSSWAMIFSLLKIIAGFITGSFITKAFSYIAPDYIIVGLTFRALWNVVLFLIVLGIFSKRKI